ncbi:hypothetical protein HanOQP8_Chr11g0385881 [Helianthus annuus]|nr:hypothetical protein HanOQP8_Chr11g0385881 [Helianthus annuus]
MMICTQRYVLWQWWFILDCCSGTNMYSVRDLQYRVEKAYTHPVNSLLACPHWTVLHIILLVLAYGWGGSWVGLCCSAASVWGGSLMGWAGDIRGWQVGLPCSTSGVYLVVDFSISFVWSVGSLCLTALFLPLYTYDGRHMWWIRHSYLSGCDSNTGDIRQDWLGGLSFWWNQALYPTPMPGTHLGVRNLFYVHIMVVRLGWLLGWVRYMISVFWRSLYSFYCSGGILVILGRDDFRMLLLLDLDCCSLFKEEVMSWPLHNLYLWSLSLLDIITVYLKGRFVLCGWDWSINTQPRDNSLLRKTIDRICKVLQHDRFMGWDRLKQWKHKRKTVGLLCNLCIYYYCLILQDPILFMMSKCGITGSLWDHTMHMYWANRISRLFCIMTGGVSLLLVPDLTAEFWLQFLVLGLQDISKTWPGYNFVGQGIIGCYHMDILDVWSKGSLGFLGWECLTKDQPWYYILLLKMQQTYNPLEVPCNLCLLLGLAYVSWFRVYSSPSLWGWGYDVTVLGLRFWCSRVYSTCFASEDWLWVYYMGRMLLLVQDLVAECWSRVWVLGSKGPLKNLAWYDMVGQGINLLIKALVKGWNVIKHTQMTGPTGRVHDHINMTYWAYIPMWGLWRVIKLKTHDVGVKIQAAMRKIRELYYAMGHWTGSRSAGFLDCHIGPHILGWCWRLRMQSIPKPDCNCTKHRIMSGPAGNYSKPGQFGLYDRQLGLDMLGWALPKLKHQLGALDLNWYSPHIIVISRCNLLCIAFAFNGSVFPSRSRFLFIPSLGSTVSYFWSPMYVLGDVTGVCPLK